MKILITQRVQDYLSGSGAGQATRWHAQGDPIPEGEDAETMSLAHKIFDQRPTRKDRAVWVDLTPEEIETLALYVSGMRDGGRDNSYEPDGRADLVSANALLRKLL